MKTKKTPSPTAPAPAPKAPTIVCAQLTWQDGKPHLVYVGSRDRNYYGYAINATKQEPNPNAEPTDDARKAYKWRTRQAAHDWLNNQKRWHKFLNTFKIINLEQLDYPSNYDQEEKVKQKPAKTKKTKK